MNDNKNHSFKRPNLKSHSRMRMRRILRNWPVLIWIAAIGASIFLYSRGSKFGNFVGTVETVVEELAPLETARLLSVEVQRGQKVKAGEVVVRLDTALLDAELAEADTAYVEIENDMTRNMLEIVHRFESSLNEAESALSEKRLELQISQGELDLLKQEYARLIVLLEKRVITEEAMADIRLRMASLELMVESYPGLIAIAEQRVEAVRHGREQLAEWIQVESGEDLTAAITRKMQAAKDMLESGRELRQRKRDYYELKASRDTVVSAIFNEPGEVIIAGQPVIRLVQEKSTRVIGFLPEVHVGSMHVGQKAWVWRQTGDSLKIAAIVESISPEVDALPGRVSPLRAQPVRGRRVVLLLTDEHDFIPGETVQIRTSMVSWL